MSSISFPRSFPLKLWHLAIVLLFTACTAVANPDCSNRGGCVNKTASWFLGHGDVTDLVHTEDESQVPRSCTNMENNTNYAGHDITGPGLSVTSLQACCDLCNSARYPDCLYFTFNPNAQCGSKQKGCCHLKTSKAGARHSGADVSGASSTHHPPPPPPPPSPPAPPGAKNVLLMIADDLRPQLNAAYGQTFMQTPHMDAFTHTALTFTRAFVQQQVCSPSP